MPSSDLPRFDTATLRAQDAAHHLHPFTDTQSLNASGTRIIVRGEGVRIWDSDGNEIIDGMSGLWCVNLGYGRQDLVDAATRQMQTLPFYKDRKSTRLNSSHSQQSRMPSSA